MLSKPVVDLIHELHRLGRQLAVLKRLYQSYELIMMRILQRQRMLRDEARSNRPQWAIGQSFGENDGVDAHHSTSRSSFSFSTIPDASVGVQLNPPAVARFERLLDRIKLYCLSEIDSCLTEKENLTFLVGCQPSRTSEMLTH